MAKNIVSFETAKLAKEKGFKGYCWNYYGSYPNGGTKLQSCSGTKVNINNGTWGYNAPTQTELQDWLRVVFNITIWVQLSDDEKFTYECVVVSPDKSGVISYGYDWNEVLEEGLIDGLNKL